jgi:SAM-dependent methyltransferase
MGPEFYDPAAYGDTHAEVYDRIYANAFATDLAARRLADLAAARGGPVLDLGIGTGRLARPLRRAGIEVHGIDASPTMIAQLRADPDTADIPVWEADMADFDLPNRYAVIVGAVSTLFMLPSRLHQAECLAHAARHLRPDGVVVIEAFVPDPSRYDAQGNRLELRQLSGGALHLVVSHHQPGEQAVTVTHVLAGPRGIDRYPVTLRYLWPSELDHMACSSGLELLQRDRSWDGRPFDEHTTDHVSIYQPPSLRTKK